MPTAAVIKKIAAARNEYESFQVVVAVPDGSDPVVVESISAAFPSALDEDAVVVHRCAYLNISVVSNCAGSPGRWPDPLIPDRDVYVNEKRNAFPATVASGTNQAFWVDLFVKNGTAPGTHEGTITMQARGTSSTMTLPLSLEVYKFALPSISRYATTYNCNNNDILTGYFLKNIPPNTTGAQRAKFQKDYVDLGLMHRVTFSDFLDADREALGLCGTVCLNNGDPDWELVQQQWGDYLGWNGATVRLPYGLTDTRPTTIQLPALHYPGPKLGAINKTIIDELWHATGCPNKTPAWGYAYWSSQAGMGTHDMLTYCKHSSAGDSGPWAKACGAEKGAKCTLQTAPTDTRPANNTLAIKYWRQVASKAKVTGWWDRVFDYTCDEPGADPSRYPVCAAHAAAIHEADPDYQVMITAEKPSADSVNISSVIDIWVPIINFVEGPKICEYGGSKHPDWYTGDHRQDYEPLVNAGKGLWWYQSCMSEGCASAVQPAHGSSAPGCDPDRLCTNGLQPNVTWPSYMIDAPGTFNRVMSWMSYQYQIEGELYWGSNAADGHYTDPNNSSWDVQWLAGGNGDGSVTYPGRPDKIGGSSPIPIASVRLKQIRDGLEDLEYMYLLEDAAGREATRKIVSQVVRKTYDFTHDAESMMAARAALASAIEGTLGL